MAQQEAPRFQPEVFRHNIDVWNKHVWQHKLRSGDLEDEGFSSIESFLRAQLPDTDRARYIVDNDTVITAAARSMGIIGTQLSSHWLKDCGRGTLEIEFPTTEVPPHSFSFNFSRLDSKNRAGGFEFHLTRHTEETNELGKVGAPKIVRNSVSVSVNYVPGLIEKHEGGISRTYELRDNLGQRFVDVLERLNTTDKILFAGELFSGVFAQNPTRINSEG